MSTAPPGPLSPVVAEDLEHIATRARTALRALSGSTTLVAGAAGFLPSYIVDTIAWANDNLLDDPARLICLDNFSTGLPDRLAHLHGRSDIELLQHDITAELAISRAVDFVVHGASIASPTWYRRRPLETIDVNVTGTRRLLEFARERDVAGLAYLSSSEVYGDPPPDRIPTPETYWGHVSATGPRAPYDESKRLAETLCTTFFRHYGTPAKLIRPFNVYGPRLRLDDARVVPDFLSDVLAGRPITLLSGGRDTRSFCYVADFTSAVLLLLTHGEPGEAYNVGNDEEVTIRQLAETLDSLPDAQVGIVVGTSDDPEYLTDNPARRCPDLSKTQAAIDWKPVVPLVEGLARTLAHYRQVGA